MKWSILAASLLVLALSSTSAHAVPFGFDCITDNDAADCAIGVSQLSLDVTDAGSTWML